MGDHDFYQLFSANQNQQVYITFIINYDAEPILSIKTSTYVLQKSDMHTIQKEFLYNASHVFFLFFFLSSNPFIKNCHIFSVDRKCSGCLK